MKDLRRYDFVTIHIKSITPGHFSGPEIRSLGADDVVGGGWKLRGSFALVTRQNSPALRPFHCSLHLASLLNRHHGSSQRIHPLHLPCYCRKLHSSIGQCEGKGTTSSPTYTPSCPCLACVASLCYVRVRGPDYTYWHLCKAGLLHSDTVEGRKHGYHRKGAIQTQALWYPGSKEENQGCGSHPSTPRRLQSARFFREASWPISSATQPAAAMMDGERSHASLVGSSGKGKCCETGRGCYTFRAMVRSLPRVIMCMLRIL